MTITIETDVSNVSFLRAWLTAMFLSIAIHTGNLEVWESEEK